MVRVIRLLVLVLIMAALTGAEQAQQPAKPFIMPVKGDPGAQSWLLGQPYGNTVGSYNFGRYWYGAGQGLHFGIDIRMPCGTELVAVADGQVMFVDDLGFGSAPHNLILWHEAEGVTTLYGHLLDRAPLVAGQKVYQGQVIGYSGDPDLTCRSRPHLHFEVRSLNYRTTFNPVSYIEAAWHSLALVGSFQYPLFVQDMQNPRRWVSLEDQPDVSFGGAILNNYTAAVPARSAERPPQSAPLLRTLDPLPAGAAVNLRPATFDGCCPAPEWHPTDPLRFSAIDGNSSSGSFVVDWVINPEDGAISAAVAEAAPPPYYSPDRTHAVRFANGQVMVTRISDGASWPVNTAGAPPVFSPNSQRLLWIEARGVSVPGSPPPQVAVRVSDPFGENAITVIEGAGINAQWLDDTRLLLSRTENRVNTLWTVDVLSGAQAQLGAYYNLRGLSAAPGGGRLLFYLTFQEDAALNGMYTLETREGAQAIKLPWFGGWRWRDADSVYFVPFDFTTDRHTLAYYHFPSGEQRMLTNPATLPFTIANGAWDVAADGSRIVFQSAADNNLWLMEIVEPGS